MKKGILICGIISFLVILFAVSPVTTQSGSGVSYGSNWESVCVEGECETTIYSYQKYWLENNDWLEIDENFDDVNCDVNYDYCVDRNLYQVHAKASPDSADAIKYVGNGAEITFQPLSLNYRNSENQIQQISTVQGSLAVVENNMIFYEDSFVEGTDLSYFYLPKMLKQELILRDDSVLPEPAGYILSGNDVTLDVDFQIDFDNDVEVFVEGSVWNKQNTVRTSSGVLFKKNGEVVFEFPEPVAYDVAGNLVELEYEFKKQGGKLYVVLKTPYRWLLYDEYVDAQTGEPVYVPRSYPVHIDPSVGLGDINWNGGVEEDASPEAEGITYTRTNNPLEIRTGNLKTGVNRRGDIDWDLSAVSDDASVNRVVITLYSGENVGTGESVALYEMEKNSSEYPNQAGDCQGNCRFYKDMGNGTVYGLYTFHGSAGSTFMNFTFSQQGREALQNALASDVFSTGIKSLENTGKNMTISMKDALVVARRPKLTVNYAVVPSIYFVDPTPASGSQSATIPVNISSSDVSDHYTFVDLQDDLLLWMRMDDVDGSGNPVDLSSYGNDGTLQGDTAITEEGYWGNGSIHDGRYDYITLDSGVEFSADDEWSVSLWANKREDSIDISGMLFGENGTTKSFVRVKSGVGLLARNSFSNDVPFNSVTNFTGWHHYVLQGNGSDFMFYFDGEFQGSGHPNAQTGSGIVIDSIGNGYNLNINSNHSFNGTIDEVLIFNRSLKTGEVSSLYSASVNQYFNDFDELSEGEYGFVGHAVDKFANRNQTEERTVTVNYAPEVTINFARDSLYGVAYLPAVFSVSLSENGSVMYSLDGGINNVSMTGDEGGIYGTEFTHTNDSIADGAYTMSVYATDVFGIKNYGESSTFSIDSVLPDASFISPTPLSGSNQTGTDIYVNLSTSDDGGEHYSLVNFDDDLVFWMKMDDKDGSGNPMDLSSYGNDGVLMGDAFIDEFGYWGDRAVFDGDGDYINLSSQVSFAADDKWSLSFWANKRNNIDLQGGIIGEKESANNFVHLNNLHDIIRFRTYNGGSGQDFNFSYSDFVGWHHYVLVAHDGANVSLYVDGAFIEKINGHVNYPTGFGGTDFKFDAIGDIVNNEPREFNGSIDEVAVFSRALDETEILALHDASSVQYEHDFAGLSTGEHAFTGYAVDLAGNKIQTDERVVTIF